MRQTIRTLLATMLCCSASLPVAAAAERGQLAWLSGPPVAPPVLQVRRLPPVDEIQQVAYSDHAVPPVLINSTESSPPLDVAKSGHKHGNDVSCPACNYVCEFSAQKVTETKTCYVIEHKPICVPPITFPWEQGHGDGKDGAGSPGPRCGKVKIVGVLVKEEYECSRCKCTWTAVLLRGEKGAEAKYYSDGDGATVDPADGEAPLPPDVSPTARQRNPISAFMRFAKQHTNVSKLFARAANDSRDYSDSASE